jgi:anti-sigma regulatory factor (Ser/Thr protein kinase)
VIYDRSIRETFRLSFEPTHVAASSARREARELIDGCGIPTVVAVDVELIVAELASNAVEQEPPSPIRLQLEVQEASVLIIVTNRVSGGERLVPEASANDALDDDLADRGWGLAIVENLSDGLWIESDDQSTSVTALRRFQRLD